MDFTAILGGDGTGWVVWMIVLFAGVLSWAFRPKNRNRRDQDGDL